MTPTNTPVPASNKIKVPLPEWLGPDTPENRERLQAFVEAISVPASEAADVAEIPQEILDEADEICSQIAEFGKPAQETIARALMARDQRAAEIARHLNGWGSNPAPELAEHIATAILTYGAKP